MLLNDAYTEKKSNFHHFFKMSIGIKLRKEKIIPTDDKEGNSIFDIVQEKKYC